MDTIGRSWVEGHRKYLLFLANRHIDDGVAAQSASDIVQQTMARAVEKMDQCRATNDEQRRGWLRQILINQIRLDRRRSIDKNGSPKAPQLEADLAQSSQAIENLAAACQTSVRSSAIRREQLERVLTALENLPQDQRQAVELRHLSQYPVAKVAELMQVTVPSVAGLLRRGLQELRRELGDESE